METARRQQVSRYESLVIQLKAESLAVYLEYGAGFARRTGRVCGRPHELNLLAAITVGDNWWTTVAPS